jgi:hypothetical protein
MLSADQLLLLVPLATRWAQGQEARILARGRVLDADEQADARFAGVAHPDRVRVLVVQRMPQPDHPRLQAAILATNVLSPGTVGLTLGYGILILSAFQNDRHLLVHELAHSAQYERFGSIDAFLTAYFTQYLAFGYAMAPLERAAQRIADERYPTE